MYESYNIRIVIDAYNYISSLSIYQNYQSTKWMVLYGSSINGGSPIAGWFIIESPIPVN